MRLISIFVVFLMVCLYSIPARAQTIKAPASSSRYEAVTKGTKIIVGAKKAVDKGSKASPESYPEALIGNWGGRLKIYRCDVLPLYNQIDSKLAKKTAEHLKPGRICSLNFKFFKNEEGKVSLTVSPGIVMIPASSSNLLQQFLSSSNSKMSPEKKARMRELINQKQSPIQMNFGPFKTSADRVGITGNQSASSVLSESFRELEECVFEQRIVLRSNHRSKGGKTISQRLDENIFWIKKVDKQDYLYVRIATLEGTNKGQLLNRLIMAGNLVKGKVVQTDAEAIARQTFR